MKFLPYEKYTLSTPLTISQAQQRLLDNLEPERNWGYIMRNKTKPYQGTLNSDGFSIQRIIRYRNSFLPVITGRFSNATGGTTITIRMRLTTFTLIFMSFWMGVVGMVNVGIMVMVLKKILNPNYPLPPAVIIPVGMLFFGYSLVMIPFKYESANAKEFLAQLFQAA